MDETVIAADALRAFAVFAEQRNFTRAAALLHISQPALHVKVGKLAATLGRQLYTRHGRQLVLTADGEAVARFARAQDERTAAFLAELRTGAAGRPLVLAAGEGAYLYLLGEAVRRLLGGAGSRLRLLTCDRDAMLAAVTAGRAHLGVGVLDAPPDGLATVPLASFAQVAVLPSGHRLAGRRRLALADLDGERLVVPPPGRPHREALERAMRSAGARWSVAVEAEGWPLMVHFVALGVGLAVVNGVVRPGPGLVARPLRDLPEVTYQAVHAPGGREDERTAELLATIAASLPAGAGPP